MGFKHREDVPNVGPGQNAFELDGGDVVVIETTQQEVATNPLNFASEHHLAVKVRGWKVDATTGEAVAGHEMPAKVITIPYAAVAEGTANIENDIAQENLDALVRMENWLKMKKIIARLPKTQ